MSFHVEPFVLISIVAAWLVDQVLRRGFGIDLVATLTSFRVRADKPCETDDEMIAPQEGSEGNHQPKLNSADHSAPNAEIKAPESASL